MKIAGFNFEKIHAEKQNKKVEKVNITSRVNISDVKELQQEAFKSKDGFLYVQFLFALDYNPDVAQIEFSGHLVLSLDQKQLKNFLKEWENKQIPEEFRNTIYNIIIKKSSIRALTLEEELNLPSHIPFPMVKQEPQ